jgi:hypothetical protein
MRIRSRGKRPAERVADSGIRKYPDALCALLNNQSGLMKTFSDEQLGVDHCAVKDDAADLPSPQDQNRVKPAASVVTIA